MKWSSTSTSWAYIFLVQNCIGSLLGFFFLNFFSNLIERTHNKLQLSLWDKENNLYGYYSIHQGQTLIAIQRNMKLKFESWLTSPFRYIYAEARDSSFVHTPKNLAKRNSGLRPYRHKSMRIGKTLIYPPWSILVIKNGVTGVLHWWVL